MLASIRLLRRYSARRRPQTRELARDGEYDGAMRKTCPR